MYRDALTTAANLGAFVRFIFIHPMRDKGRKREGGREELRQYNSTTSFQPHCLHARPRPAAPGCARSPNTLRSFGQ